MDRSTQKLEVMQDALECIVQFYESPGQIQSLKALEMVKVARNALVQIERIKGQENAEQACPNCGCDWIEECKPWCIQITKDGPC